jgi:DNA-binding transcriptional LysR family regulator
MDLRKLNTFRIVARYESLSRAAALGGLTVPAVSIQIKKLEEELGAKLFEHYPKKLILTDKGRLFLKEANRVFEAVDRAKASIAGLTDGYVGNVSVALHTDLSKLYAPQIAQFVKTHPKLDVTILTRSSREILELVENGEIDIGIGFFKTVPRLIRRKMIQETNISLVFPRGHRLHRRKLPTLAEIAKFRVVMRRRSSPTRQMIDDTFSKNAVDMPNVLEVGRCQSVMEFVKLGLGVGLVHTICGRAEPQKHLIQLELKSYFENTDVSIITHSNSALSAAHQALIDAFAREAADIDSAL